MSARPADRVRGSCGQASVEFALTLPVIVVMALTVVFVGVAVRNELAVELAAREGARAAAVAASPAAAASAAATRAVTLPIVVETTIDGSSITVTVSLTDPTDLAVIGAFVGPITHTASATMALEPP